MAAEIYTDTELTPNGMGGEALNEISHKRSWTSMAFLVEALLLLLFLAASIAITVNISLKASTMGADASRLTTAVTIARDAAEVFAAAPDAVGGSTQVGNYSVNYDIRKEYGEAGILYHAKINVYSADVNAKVGDSNANKTKSEPIYSITTSRYVAKEVSNG